MPNSVLYHIYSVKALLSTTLHTDISVVYFLFWGSFSYVWEAESWWLYIIGVWAYMEKYKESIWRGASEDWHICYSVSLISCVFFLHFWDGGLHIVKI